MSKTTAQNDTSSSAQLPDCLHCGGNQLVEEESLFSYGESPDVDVLMVRCLNPRCRASATVEMWCKRYTPPRPDPDSPTFSQMADRVRNLEADIKAARECMGNSELPFYKGMKILNKYG